jgi:DNA polymerase-4
MGLKVRYAPFFTQSYSRKLPASTRSLDEMTSAVLALAESMEPGREVRLLGVRAEMVMPDGGVAIERTPVRGRI